jgi:ABC-type nickel/cobalt efflux system permease component RcnA
MLNDSVLTTIAITGFGIAFFHAAIPTHWLPFVLTARMQRWNRVKTLAITAIAATGHATFTAALGLGVAWLGIALSARIGDWFPRIAGGILIAFGLFYIVRQITGHTHTHLHFGHSHSLGHKHNHDQDHDHDHTHVHDSTSLKFTRSDFAAISSLLALLTFSPCEAFVPVYVSGVRYGWHGFALLTIILTVATIAGMMAFTFLALIGIEQVKLRSLEKYEAIFMGALLSIVGALIILFEK